MTSVALSAPVQTGTPPAPFTPPVPLNKDALRTMLELLDDPETLKLQQRLAGAYDRACAALIGPGDVQIDGKNKDGSDRVFKKKSAWRKLGRHFTISTQVVRDELRILDDETFIALVVVRGIASWGQVTEAIAACGSDEESGRRTITMADAIGTAQTRATNRAISDLIAMGEVSAEEIGERAPRENGKKRERTRPELTLEDALELEFPWKDHAKYGGKPLKEVSTRLLLSVSKWAKAKIDAGNDSQAIADIYRAAVLITEQRPDLEATIAAQQASIEKDEKEQDATNATAAPADPRQLDVLADGPGATPPAAAPDLKLVPDEPAAPLPPRTPRTGSSVEELNVAAQTAAASSSPAAQANSAPLPYGTDLPLTAPVTEAAGAPPETLAELRAKFEQMLADPRTPADVLGKYRQRLADEKLITGPQYRRAIAELALILEIGG